MKIKRTRYFIRAFLALLMVWAWANPISTATAAGAPRILPLGDSITQGDQQHGSYRRSLWQRLVVAGIPADFVGSTTNHYDGNVLNPDYDLDHEGHGGFKAEELLGGLPGWISLYTPDVCLLHAGSNDVFQDQDNTSTVAELGQIIDALRADNPAMVVLLAKIIPRNNAVYSQRITNLNTLIAGLAAAKTMPESPVIVVDQNTGFNAATDTFDAIHPNELGTEKMAQKWFEALQPILSTNQPPRPPAAFQTVSGNQQIALSWVAPLSATTFSIKRAAASGGPYSVIVSNLAATSFTNLGLANGTTYYYVVTALNGFGESLSSAEVSAVPAAGPASIVQLAFDETSGTTTANSGTSGGFLTLTVPFPERTDILPANVGGARAINMGVAAGNYAMDSTAPLPPLGGLTKFTVTAWINNRDIAQGSGGNRIVTWLGPDLNGVELVYRGDGSLILSVNEEPSSARSSIGMIPTDFAASPGNWRFLAVTYDAAAERVQFYFGSNSNDALLDKAVSYTGRGAVGPATGRFTVGHLNPERRSGRENRIFRGLIDQVQIFGSVLSPSEIVAVQRGGAVPPPPPPPPVASFTGTPTSGAAPLAVTFTDNSTGSFTTRWWSFGDGTTTNTSGTNTTHTYSAPGTNTITLIVSGPDGSNTLTRTAYVIVTNLPPGSGGPLTRVANTTLQMPESPPQTGFTTTNALGGLLFANPIALASLPGETNRLFIAEQAGLIYVITNLANPTKTIFLNLTSVVHGGTSQQQQGLSSIAFHPGYATNGCFYVCYVRVQSSVGFFNRLARFQTAPGNPNQALRESELVLIDQFDEGESHNFDDLRFGPDGYLYVSIGDEGDPADQFVNAQKINKDFFSGILRLDVDKRPGNLQPNPHPASSTNYFVPADNPFVGATSFNGNPVDPAQVRTEFYAVGLRNPWRLWFDSVTGWLYCGDVGESSFEEVNIITKGGNYGWAFLEAAQPGPRAAGTPPGFHSIPPVLQYQHGGGYSEGRSVIGGVVYRGTRLAQIQGAYIFADYVTGNIWQLRYDGTTVSDWERLCFDKDIASFGLDPRNGDVLLCDISEGKVKRLDYAPTPPGVNSLPPTLADTGAFADLASLTPNPGVVPYDINVPFWSDHALKSRWFSVPHLDQKIGFSPDANWSFPAGTVWVKHFDIDLTNGVPSSRRRLETRFIVKNSDGVYGVTYRWSNSVTNAILVPEEGLNESFVIRDGGMTRTQVWHYPSRSECLSCHTTIGGYAGGFNTPQLNRAHTYGDVTHNQIKALSDAGYFQSPVNNVESLLALAPAADATASLEWRARSYLFANCVYCHQPGGSGGGLWDARITTPLSAAAIINGYLIDNGGNPTNRVLKPGLPAHSMLLNRISSPPPLRMPPLGTSEFDTRSISLVRDWIGSMLKILPLGDSLTSGDSTHNSYRRPLWQMLTNAGIYTDFVGSLNSNFGGGPTHPDFDMDHEGHAGWRVNELLASLPGWLAGYTPDICLLLAGSNDAFLNESTASTISELGQVIDLLRSDNPHVIILLAKPIGSIDPLDNQRINDLNSQIDSLAAAKNTPTSRVLVVDLNTGFDPAADTYDGVHPNPLGEQKIAGRWFVALQTVLTGLAAPPPPLALSATAGNGQVSLTWQAPLGATGYNVKRSTTSGGNYSIIATNFHGTIYTNVGLANDITYYYVITALNGDGESQNSAQAGATPRSGQVPLAKLSFDEPGGTIATNQGSAGGTLTLTTPQPARTGNVPQFVGGTGAIDMGNNAGNYGVDSPSPISALIGLSRFTVTGWLNNRSIIQGSGGNRVLSCIDNGGDGFELIYKSDGSLIFTLNQGPDSDSPRSSTGMLPEDYFAGAANWRFFAITYDSTLQQVRFYFGSNTNDAALDVTKNYPGRGPIGPGTGRLTIGHMNPANRASYTSRMFRGLIDEVRIYGSLLSSNEIIAVQRETISASGTPSVTNCPGTSVTFTPTVSGAGPFTYQWLKEGVVIPGATNSIYSIATVAPADAATYCVHVTGPVEGVTNCTILNVLSATTALGPVSQAACPGATLTLATVPSGTPGASGFTFRWRKNGVLIPGATASLYTIGSVAASDAGAYCVEVTGACNSVTNCATLTVLTNTTAIGPVSLTNCSGHPVTFSTLAAGSPGSSGFSYQWRRNGTNISGASNSTYTIPAVTAADAGAYFVEVHGACNAVTNSATLVVLTNTSATSLVSLTNCPGTTAIFSTLASGTGPFTYRWRKNGSLISGANGSSHTIPAASPADAGTYCVEVTGSCNSVTNCATLTVLTNTTATGPLSLTNCPSTPATLTTLASGTPGPSGFLYQWSKNGAPIPGATNSNYAIAAVTQADAGIFCVQVAGACGSVTNCAALTVLTNVNATSLVSLTNCPGASALFSTVASGSGPFSYRWSKDSVLIAGATNSALSITSIGPADAGAYCVVVTGACGSVTRCATLTVLTPTAATALSSLTNCPGTAAGFATTVSGSGPFSYQWRRNGAVLAGATNSSLTLASVTASDAGTYCVEVSGACNRLTNCATLTVLASVAASGPQSLTNCPGSSATFSTVASGSGPLTYQWRKNGVLLAGATNAEHTVTAVNTGDEGAYCVEVTGACGTVTNCASLTVLTPTSASGLASLTNCPGTSAHFATIPSGSPGASGFRFQWRYNGVAIPNATNSSLSFANVSAADAGLYCVIVTDACNSVTNCATLTVLEPTTASAPVSLTNCIGANAILATVASGTPGPSGFHYQWRHNGTLIPGATNEALVVATTRLIDAGTYCVEVSGACNRVTNCATLTVYESITVNGPLSLTNCPGNMAALTAAVTGTSPVVYRWLHDGVPMVGATNSSLVLDPMTAADAGVYCIEVKGACNDVTNCGTLTVLTNVAATRLVSLARCPGEDATFSTVATGTPGASGFRYQWKREGVDIPGATNSFLSISQVGAADAGQYCVEVTGACNTVTNYAALIVHEPVSASGPEPVTTCPGMEAIFSVAAGGTGPFAYQWSKDGSPMAGATNEILMLASVDQTDAGTYSVEVQGLCNRVTNSTTLLVMTNTSASGLASLTNCPGTSAHFATIPSGSPGASGFRYLWRHQGVGIPGGTNSTLVLPAVSASEAGEYCVEVTGACQTVTNYAWLEVLLNTVAAGPSSLTNCPGTAASFTTSATGFGVLVYQWSKDGVAIPGATNASYSIPAVTDTDAGAYCAEITGLCNSVTNCATLTVLSPTSATRLSSLTNCPGTSATFTTLPSGSPGLSGFRFRWLHHGIPMVDATNSSLAIAAVDAASAGEYCVEVTGACNTVTNCATLTVLTNTTATSLVSLTRCPGQSATFSTITAGTPASTGFRFQWRHNGALIPDATNSSFVIAAVEAMNAGAYCVEVSGACSSVTRCATLTVLEPASALGPVSQTNCPGTAMVLTTLGSGSGPLRYQWTKNGGPIPGATNSNYAVSSVSAADAGAYCVEVTGPCNAVTNCATLTVTELTAATALSSLTNCPGTSASFETIASGTPGPSGFQYRWSRNGTVIAGATTSAYLIPVVSSDDAGIYCVEVTGSCNTVTNCAWLEVLVNASASNPASLTNCPGDTAAFSTLATGTGPFHFQWTKEGVPIVDATNYSLTIPSVSAADSGAYCVEVTGACGSVTNCATLTVLAATAASALVPQFRCPGTTAIFTTTPSGSPGPSGFHYRWTRDGVPIAAATNASYSIAAVNAADTGLYCVEVTGVCNTATNCAALTVLADVVALGPSSLSNCPGTEATFSTEVSGTGPFTYLWLKDGVPLPDATNETFTIPTVNAVDAGSYCVEVSGDCSRVTNCATLTVNEPVSASALAAQTNCTGSAAMFATIPAGTDPFSFRWTKDGATMPSATNSSLIIPSLTLADAGLYCVEVTGRCNSVTNCAALTVYETTTATALASLTNCPGTPALFRTVASGTTGPSGFRYRWTLNGAPISGATNDSFSIDAVSAADAGAYCVEVTGACNSVTHCAWLHVNEPITVTGPDALTNCPGTHVAFTTAVTGSGPFTYRWTKDGTSIPGATNGAYSIASVNPTDGGIYCVEVQGACNRVTNCATLTVNEPVTATGLISLTNCPGLPATFATSASGTPGSSGFRYRWLHNGTPMANATNSSFTISAVSAVDAGAYSVEVTGDCNHVTNWATLSVLLPTAANGPSSRTNCPGTAASFITMPSGSPGWSGFLFQWTKDGVAILDATNNSYVVASVSQEDAGVYCAEVTGACGSVTNCATLSVSQLTASTALAALVNCPGTTAVFETVASGTPGLSGFSYQWTHQGLAISGATNSSLALASLSAADAGDYCVEVTGSCHRVTNCATLTVLTNTTATGPLSLTNCPGTTAAFTTLASGTPGSSGFLYQWSKNGAPIPSATNSSYAIAAVTQADAGTFCVQVTGACGSVTNCANLTVLTNVNATSLVSLTNCPDASALFSTVASGSGPFSYRWSKDDVGIAGATNSVWSIAAISSADAGAYCVEVTGACGSVTRCATLTVLTPTTATALTSLTNCPGTAAGFGTTVSGSGPFSYRWRKDGAVLVSATNSSLNLPSVTASDAGTYCVEVSGACNRLTNCATLTVLVTVAANGPQSLTNCPGTGASFSTVAWGSGPFSYQWRKEGVLLVGATNANHTVPAVNAGDEGAYCVEVTGACGRVTNCASLTVLTPTLASGLASLTNCPGTSAHFATIPSGSPGASGFRYLWRHQGVVIPGGTNSTLVLPAVSASEAGEYCVEVTGACQTVTNYAWLEVLLNTVAAGPSSLTNCPGTAASFTTSATGSGVLVYQWSKDGVAIPGATNANYSIPAVTDTDAGAYCAQITGLCNSVTNCATLTVLTPTSATSLTSLANCPGTSATFATIPSGSPGLSGFRFRWLHEGIPMMDATNSSLTIAAVEVVSAGEYCVEVTGACNTVTNCASLTVLTNTTATSLVSLTRCPGESATFSTVASGTPGSSGFLFQWRHNGAPIPEATNSTFSMAAVEAWNSGAYCVEVTGACRSVTHCANLTVLDPATAIGPLSQTNCPGTAMVLTTLASGSAPLMYQWTKNGAAIPGATNSDYAVTSVTAADVGAYCVEVTGPCNAVTNCATLTVTEFTAAVALTSLTNCPGTTAVFETTVSGTPGPSGFQYRWKHSGAVIPGATNRTFAIGSLTLADAGTYCVEVSGECNSVTNCATLTVPQPTVASGPASLTKCYNVPATFVTLASGDGPFRYQWSKDGTFIAGATNSAYTINSVTAAERGDYCVQVSGLCNSVTNCASLIVTEPVTASSLASLTTCPGTSATFSTVASGGPGSSGFTYRWSRDGALIAGATNSMFSIPAVSAEDAGEYCVEVTGACNSVTNCATLTVLLPVAATALTSLTNCPDTSATFTTWVSGTAGPAGFQFQWTRNGAPIPNATNSSHSIPRVSASDAGAYCVEVTGECGRVTNCLTLTVLTPATATALISLTNCPGNSAALSTVASGSPGVSGFRYRWTRNSLPIADATNSTYAIPSVKEDDAGTYCVEVAGACGSVTNCATLTVLVPTIATALASLTNCPSASAMFATVASGTPGVSGFVFRWKRNGVVMADATNSTFAIPEVSAADAGTYCVEVSGACGGVTNCASLFVNSPTTAAGPDSLATCPGATGVFETVASGTPGPSGFRFQWVKDGLPIADATNSSYTVPAVSAEDIGSYCVEVRGACGSVTNCALLTILTNTAAASLVSLTNCPGTSATFETVASGTPGLSGFTYRWRKSGTLIANATNRSLSIASVTAADTGTYCVEVSGACGSATNCATLSVNPATSATGLNDTTKIIGEDVTFSTTASGTGPFAFMWFKDGSVIAGADGSSLTLTNLTLDDSGQYCVAVAGDCGSVTRCSQLTVLPPSYLITAAVAPVDGGSTSGSGTHTSGSTVTVVATAHPGYSFTNWTENGVVLSASASYSLTVSTNRVLQANFVLSGPVPIVHLALNERTGTNTVNLGSGGGAFGLTRTRPTWETNAPAGAGGGSAVDFAVASGDYAVDSALPISQLGGLTRFTITGWVNNRDIAQGSGGNRLVTWLGPDNNGVELVYRGDGSLILSVDEEPSSARSSAGMITTDFAASAANWRFFAATYDGPAGLVQFYFGSNAADAALDRAVNYSGRGAVGPPTARLTVGHLNPERRAGQLNRLIRGLMDDVRIFGSVLSPSEIVAVQRSGAAPPSPPPPPVADFTATPTSGTAPLTVTFTDSSTGTITSRFWDFGNGTTTNSTGTNSSRTYTMAGTNTVSLTVTGPGGSNVLTRVAYIVVTNAPPPPPPVANFTGTPASGAAPLVVTFTDSSTGTITNRFWTFGNSATTNSTATSVTRTYTTAGTNTVALTVTGPGGSATQTRTAYVVVTNAATGADLVGHWKLDDGGGTMAADSSDKAHHGTLLNGPSYSSGYCAGGLTFDGVNDCVRVASTGLLEFAGRNFTMALWIKSSRSGPQALVEKQHSGFTGCFLLALNRDGVVPGALSVWTGNQWIDSNFRGLTDGQWHHVAVTYDGTAFRLFRDGVMDSMTTATAPYLVTTLPLNFGRFDTGGMGWLFQGQMDEVRRFNRTLSDPEIADLTQCVSVPPAANFGASPISGGAPLNVSFTDSSKGTITDRFWSFGDGTTTNTAATAFTHIYGAAGTNTVNLTVSGPGGSDSLVRTAYIVVTNVPPPPPPVANFAGTPTSGSAPLTVTFTDSSTGSITNRFWNFGDGTTTNTPAATVTRTYATAATNTVTLTVSGAGGSNTLMQVEYVVVTNGASGPGPIVNLPFNEGSGTTVVNVGSAGGFLSLSAPRPVWSSHVPAGVGGLRAIDMGSSSGNFGVESATPLSALRGLTSFTITGWVNNKDAAQGSGGNRLVVCQDNGGDGIDLAYRGDGSLVLGVNQYPDGVARSSAGKITSDFSAGAANWRFFAVIYDGGAKQVKFYFGSNLSDATLDVTKVYARGSVGTNLGRLCIGNMNSVTRGTDGSRIFRGLIDEVQIHGAVLSPAEIITVQRGTTSPIQLASPRKAAVVFDSQAEQMVSAAPALAPQITGVTLEGGIVRLQVSGPVGQRCQILASDTLAGGTPISTNLVGTTGTFEVFEIHREDVPARFYRVVTP